jgi:uncharacterized membrane protein
MNPLKAIQLYYQKTVANILDIQIKRSLEVAAVGGVIALHVVDFCAIIVLWVCHVAVYSISANPCIFLYYIC